MKKNLFSLIIITLPHISIILSVMLIVFLIIDSMNSAMNFLGNKQTKIILLVLSISSAINGVRLSEAHIRNTGKRRIKLK